MRNMDVKVLVVFFCVVHLSIYCQGGPLRDRKRTLGEVQLMHNLRKYQMEQERRKWLQAKMQEIYNRPSGGDTDELPRLTPEEIQKALDFVENLLKSKQG